MNIIVNMTVEESFYIGYISKRRGLKGELQLFFEFEDYQDLSFDVIFVEMNKKLVPYFVGQIKFHVNSTAYLNLEDVDHIDLAQPLVRKKVYLSLKDKPERDPEDFRLTDLKGYLVVDEEEGEIGVITDVQEFPQQTMAFVDFNGKELMFPLNEDLMLFIDVEDKVLEVQLPEGLIDLYTAE